MTVALSIFTGVVVLVVPAGTGHFVAQEFAYMAVDRNRLKARAADGDVGARRALGITGRTSFMLSGAQLATITGLRVGLCCRADDRIRPGAGAGRMTADSHHSGPAAFLDRCHDGFGDDEVVRRCHQPCDVVRDFTWGQ